MSDGSGSIAIVPPSPYADVGELARRARKLSDLEHLDLIVGGATLSRSALDALGGQLATVARLLCELPARIGGDLVAAARALGQSAEDAAVLADFAEALDPATLMRADLVHRAGRWRLLELNCGSTVGGMVDAALPRLVGLAARDTDDVLARWARWLAARVEGAGALVEDEAALAGMRPTLELLASELTRRLGATVPVLGHRALRGDHGLAWIYRLFDVADMHRDPEAYAPVRAAIAAGTLRCPMGPAYRLVGSKAALAALWTLRDHRALGSDEVAAVEALVPRTTRLTPDRRAEVLERRAELVIKPADGYGGHGVSVGREHGVASWRDQVDQALAAPEPWVMQEYAHPETRSLQIARPSGAIVEVAAHSLWGVYLLDRQVAGAFVRARPVVGGGAVINVPRGAAVGPVELTP